MTAFEQLPKVMQSKVSYMAYERGHYAGQAECDLIQESLANDLLEAVQQIQLDAMQEGMRRAADIANDAARQLVPKLAKTAILTTANNLTLKDL